MSEQKPIPPLQLHPHQQLVYDELARFRVVACGRRWGKTELGKHILWQQLQAEGRLVWWLSPTYQMAGQVWRDFKRRFRGYPNAIIHEKDRQIDFANGGVLAIRSTFNADNLRGAGLDFAVLDEAAYMKAHVWSEVVRPMLLDRQGRALFISSPNGKNWFWEIFQLGIPANPQWASFRFRSHDNPLLSPADLESIRLITSERVWRQEYEAEFVDDSGQVFRHIRERATPLYPSHDANHRYVAGVDWGREGDFTVIVVMNSDTRQMVAMDRFHQVGWDVQRGRLKALCEQWQVALIYAEANSIGSVNIEALERDGLPILPFVTTNKSKAHIIESLSLAFEQNTLQILPDDVLIQELSAYSLYRSKSGLWQYRAPLGGHDDCVIALALAWYATQNALITVDFL